MRQLFRGSLSSYSAAAKEVSDGFVNVDGKGASHDP